MIFPALMFVFGVWSVQQLAQLPSLISLLVIWFVLVVIAVLAIFPRRLIPSAGVSNLLQRLLLFAAAFLFGFCWASSFALWRMSDELPRDWEQKTIVIVGVVSSVPEITERGERIRFDVEKIITPQAVVPKHISLNQYREDFSVFANKESDSVLRENAPQNFRAGERWQLSVRLKRPHGTSNPYGFDFESWALSENVRATGSIKGGAKNATLNKRISTFVWRPQYVIESLRETVKLRIAKVLFDQPLHGVIQALVMGDDSQIKQTDWQVFLRTGTSHLVSISGLHITMLSGLVFAVVGFFWRRSPKLTLMLPTRKAATLAGVVTALCYALVAGFSVPTQRTFYMLMVFAMALWSGRQLLISQVLAFALFIVVLLDPWAVTAPGFWLSFGAVAMLAYALGARVGRPHWLVGAVQTQWAVTLGMLPLLLVMFNQTSIVSPVANAFAIPVISFVVTPLALLGSFLHLDVALHLSHQALNFCMMALIWLSELPMATWQQHAPAVWTIFPAIMGVLWLLLPKGFPLRWLGLVGVLPMVLINPARPLLGDMKVTVLDVGQGLSVVIQTATHQLLYDAGPKYNAQNDAGTRIVLPFLRGAGIYKLDGFVISHNDSDHSGGMDSVLTHMQVDWFLSSLPISLFSRKDIESIQCVAGQKWVWDNVSFEVLHPQLESYESESVKDNNRSCVIKVRSQSGSLLLTGDIEKTTELALLNTQSEILNSDIIIAPHHGSKTSSSAELIAKVAPSVVVFTSGYLNRFKHPAAEVVARYQSANVMMYRSDQHGALELNFIKQKALPKIDIETWRGRYKRYWHDVIPQ